jgi:DNA polymerase epsilon subunit 1
MYDPSIHRFVHGLMRKTFIQLLAEFKRLGSHVVYADFSRILLATSKPPGTAHAYATYITTAVNSHELFQHIYLNTEHFYDFLLFMDQANMGGIVCLDPLAVEPPEEISIEMQWNIAAFLPPAIQPDFTAAIQYYIVELYKLHQRLNGGGRAPLRIIRNGDGPPDATQRDSVKIKEMEAIQEFIARRLTRKLLKTVGSVQDRHRDAMMNDELMAGFEFPILPGSHLHLTNPVLELVKSMCAALALAKEYQVEVGLLKRNLLELIGVREFATEAVFRNPCEPLKLFNVPCRHCDSIRDMDFCRDEGLLPKNNVDRWVCANCSGEFDRLAIEFTLMDVVYGLERAFAQQDLRCSKCQQIQSDNVSRYCQCSGSYQFTLNKAEIRRKLRTIVNVAIVHRLPRLKVFGVLKFRCRY